MKGPGLLAVLIVLLGACTSSNRPVDAPPSTVPATVPVTVLGTVAATLPVTATVTVPLTAPGALPDPVYTPGATNPSVAPQTIAGTICASGWTATVRPPESYTEEVKRLETMSGGTVSYGGVTYQVHGFELADPTLSHYELDHLIPLELGGAPADPRNLWMQPYETPTGAAAKGTGSETKDKVENSARAAVCDGRLTLADAQRLMATNWLVLGRELGAA